MKVGKNFLLVPWIKEEHHWVVCCASDIHAVVLVPTSQRLATFEVNRTGVGYSDPNSSVIFDSQPLENGLLGN